MKTRDLPRALGHKGPVLTDLVTPEVLVHPQGLVVLVRNDTGEKALEVGEDDL